jgi:hypothetical protein
MTVMSYLSGGLDTDRPSAISKATAVAAVCASLLAGASPARADDKALQDIVRDRVGAFFCTADGFHGGLYLFLEGPDGSIHLEPGGHPASKSGSIYTADLGEGAISVSDDAYALLTAQGAEKGSCTRINHELLLFWVTIVASNPDAAREYFADPFSLDVSDDPGIPPSEASEAGEPTSAAENTIRKLRRENDKLKRRICDLDPTATFSVCKGP